MFNRHQPLYINGRQISSSLAIRMAEQMTEERALFVAMLRRDREYTWRMVAEECGQAWSKPWGADQDVGEALCGLASVYLNEDWDDLDR